MRKINESAPDFALYGDDEKIHHLSDYRGKKVILYFYPKDLTAGCTKQALAYSALNEEFNALATKVIAVSKDTVASHQKFKAKNALTITLLADPEHEVLKAYDVWQKKKSYGKEYLGTVRTTYLIDENGTIIFANDKVKTAEDAAKMLETVKSLTK